MKEQANPLNDVILELRMIQLHLHIAKKSAKATSRGTPIKAIEHIEYSLTNITALIDTIDEINR